MHPVITAMTVDTEHGADIARDFAPEVRRDIILDHEGDHVFLLHPFEPRWALTNRAGERLVRILDGRFAIESVAAEIAQSTGTDANEVERDLLEFARKLYSANLLRNKPLVNESLPQRAREPHRLTIYVTEECNLRCRHCFVVEGRMPSPKLSASDVRALIDSHSERYPGALIAFTGGEPMLRDDLLELMHHAHGATGKVTMNTNGLLIETLDQARAVAETMAGIQISLDGADAEVHDFLRGKGTWRRTWRSIELLCEAGGARRTRTSTTLTRCALQQIKDLIARAEELDLYEVRFLILNKLRAAETHWDTIVPDNDELMEVYRYLLLELPRKPRNSRTMVQGEFPGFVPYADPQGKHWCPIGETTIVDSQGNAYGCPTLMTAEYRTGNAATDTLDSIQRSDAHRRLREIMLQRRYVIEDCKTCAWRNFCQGGCQAFTQLRTGSPWVMDEFCDFRRELYRRNALLDAEQGPVWHGPGC